MALLRRIAQLQLSPLGVPHSGGTRGLAKGVAEGSDKLDRPDDCSVNELRQEQRG